MGVRILETIDKTYNNVEGLSTADVIFIILSSIFTL